MEENHFNTTEQDTAASSSAMPALLETRQKLEALGEVKIPSEGKGKRTSQYMLHMTLLETNDPRRIKANPRHEKDCYTHVCKHCQALISMTWKINSKDDERKGNYISTTAQRHLEKNCNEQGRNAIAGALKLRDEKEYLKQLETASGKVASSPFDKKRKAMDSFPLSVNNGYQSSKKSKEELQQEFRALFQQGNSDVTDVSRMSNLIIDYMRNMDDHHLRLAIYDMNWEPHEMMQFLCCLTRRAK
ncbi:predicted protein [Chaetoceros tenuissimus]|uniref:Uncharacterized protein n=1 Tax=Chaetoceros tenuissimus TaxID=426638 RepID=A0AAD3D1M2_9STRA|nr:predicted protein [Chaetoceros tenuissimus]